MPELPGILNWGLEGLRNYLRRRLAQPKAVLAATKDYREDMDIVGRWIEVCCDEDPTARVSTKFLYDSYSFWAETEVGWKMSNDRFGRELGDRGYRKEKGTGGVRCTIGLRLKPSADRATLVTWGR